ncbi:MAG: hypothetical protein IGR76_00105 [Synechococcales cyanobacterium T60_A2020_003]|nr:hypothetical protein [Synechococcales cyanobacterium T60_A2020_003]
MASVTKDELSKGRSRQWWHPLYLKTDTPQAVYWFLRVIVRGNLHPMIHPHKTQTLRKE